MSGWVMSGWGLSGWAFSEWVCPVTDATQYLLIGESKLNEMKMRYYPNEKTMRKMVNNEIWFPIHNLFSKPDKTYWAIYPDDY